MTANGRFFFEGIPLGNREPLAPHPQMQRAVKGSYGPGFAQNSGPIIGAGGYSTRLTIQGQHENIAGDFQPYTIELMDMQDKLASVTKIIEDRAALEHNVSKRRLGNVAWVSDLSLFARIPAGSVIPADSAQGAIRINIPNPNTLGLDTAPFQVGDYIVILQDQQVPEYSEVGQITVTDSSGSAWVEITSRISTLTGSSPYTSLETLVYNADHVYPNYVFRDLSYGRPRNLSEAGASADGLTFLFEGYEKPVLRGSLAAAQSTTFTSQSLLGAGGDFVLPGA